MSPAPRQLRCSYPKTDRRRPILVYLPWGKETDRTRSVDSILLWDAQVVCRYFGGQETSARESSPRDVAAQWPTQRTQGSLPGRVSRFFGDSIRRLSVVRITDDCHERRKLFFAGSAADDPHVGGRLFWGGHSGMFPCFFGGSSLRLPRSDRSALAIETRVLAGSMMPSISPRSAARNGEVTL